MKTKHVCRSNPQSPLQKIVWVLSLCLLNVIFFIAVACSTKQNSIVILYPNAPRSLDCHLRKELVTISILSNIYEPLVFFDANMNIIPMLADYWERKDSLTWIFYLRPGVLFHNGARCRVNDVIYSLYRPMRLPQSEFKDLQNVVDTIMGEDTNKIIIKTKMPRMLVSYDIALISIVPDGYNPSTARPTGTGPYHYVSSDSQTMILEAFPGYWGKRCEIKKACYRFIPNYQDRIKLFTEGKADIVTYLLLSAVEDLKKIGRVVASPGVLTRYLEFNLRKFPFNNNAFRQAVNLGLDREAIARDVYHGYAVPANQYIPPGVIGYDATRKHFDYNPDRAKKIIMRLGKLPTIELDYANTRYYVGEAIAEQLKKIGIPIKKNCLAPDDYWHKVENRSSDCYIISMQPNSYEGIGDLTSSFHSLDANRGLGTQNRVGYENRKLDKLIETLSLIMDHQLLEKKMSEAQEMLLKDLPNVPVVWEKNIYLVSKKIDWLRRLDDIILVKDVKVIE